MNKTPRRTIYFNNRELFLLRYLIEGHTNLWTKCLVELDNRKTNRPNNISITDTERLYILATIDNNDHSWLPDLIKVSLKSKLK